MSGFRISATIRDDAVRGALRMADKHARRDARRAIRLAVDEVLAPHVRSAVPAKSGAYRASIRSGATTSTAYVQARTPYAKVLELGRAPMRITVKSARALATPAGPRHAVQSPRYPARRTLGRAAAPHIAATARRVETHLVKALRSYL